MNSITVHYRLTILLLALVVPCMSAYGSPQAPPSAAAASSAITQIKIVQEDEDTVVRVEASGRLDFQAERLKNPERLVLDFANARLDLSKNSYPSSLSPIRQVRAGQFKPDVARIVIDLSQQAKYVVQPESHGITVSFGSGSPLPVAADVKPRAVPVVVPEKSPQPPPQSLSVSIPMNFVKPDAQPNFLGDTVENGMLTLRAQGRPLQSILKEIGDLANVSILISDDLAKEQVSVDFHGYRVDEALRQMLANYDTLFLYGKDNEKSGGLKTLWVYAQNEGPGISRFSLAAWKSSMIRTEQASNQGDAEARANAVQTLIRREGRDSMTTLLNALKDPSDKVRERALNQALLMGTAPPEDILIGLAVNDESGEVRLRALQALPVDPSLRWIAERSVNDANPQVSTVAKSILRELDVAEATSNNNNNTQASVQPQ
jgi:hypothetical protein